MYKVFIVDDEKIVRLAIKSMIKWNQETYEFAGSARNGADALKMFEQQTPDIVITDLKMPVMDGIELIKQLKAMNFDGEILVLSNYNDFELVKEAMRLGAYDYILKITVETNNFMKVLDDISQKLSKRKKAVDTVETKATERSDEKIEFLRKAVSTPEVLSDADEEQLDSLFSLSDGSYTQSFVICSEKSKTEEQSTGHKADIFSDLATDDSDWNVSVKIDDSRTLLVTHYQNQPSLSPEDAAKRIVSLSQMYYNLKTGVMYGAALMDANDFKIGLAGEINSSLLFFYGEYRNGCHVVETVTADETFLKEFESEKRNEFCTSLKDGAKDRFISCLSELVELSSSRSLNPYILKKEVKKILHGADNEMPAQNSKETDSFDIYPNDTDIIFESSTDKELLLAVGNMIDTVFKKTDKPNSYRKEIMTAIEYIENNIDKHLSITEIAEKVNMTNTYLSRIFHAETGKSIVEYINSMKMEKAYEMIKRGDCLIKEAASAVGINDQFYFNRMFKKQFGVNPSSLKN
jgi:two-component system response regulator YesN